MGKLPAFLFYPKDWMTDFALMTCSKSARGMWIDMLCLMFSAPIRGVLCTAEGTPWSDEDIARAARGDTTENLAYIAELLKGGVAHRNERGAIFSRRLVRDEEERRAAAKRQAKMRENGGGDPEQWTSIRAVILKRDDRMCAYCGRRAVTVDHIIPKSKGGNEDYSNLVACCKPCNCKKSVRTLSEAGMEFWPGFDQSKISCTSVTSLVTPLSGTATGTAPCDFDVGSKKEERTDELTERIVRAHPGNWRLKGQIQIPQAQTDAAMAAIIRDSPELVEQGVLAYAKAVERWPQSERKYITNPVKFFAESHYLKDPAEWERNHEVSKANQRQQQNLLDHERAKEIIRRKFATAGVDH